MATNCTVYTPKFKQIERNSEFPAMPRGFPEICFIGFAFHCAGTFDGTAPIPGAAKTRQWVGGAKQLKAL